MPQMSPMYWIFLLFSTLMIFYILLIKTHYFFNPTLPTKIPKIYKSHLHKTWNI